MKQYTYRIHGQYGILDTVHGQTADVAIEHLAKMFDMEMTVVCELAYMLVVRDTKRRFFGITWN